MAKGSSYQPRLYRQNMGNDRWQVFKSLYLETDLWVAVSGEYSVKDVQAYTSQRIKYYRNILENHIRRQPGFRTSLVPVFVIADVEPVIAEMYRASSAAFTGPMSAVAGAMAQFVCNDLIHEFNLVEVVVENGGDIFLKLEAEATISVYAGSSSLSEKISLLLKPEDTPLSVCTSSATVGHAFSLGRADACMIACRSGALADAYATQFCNKVKSKDQVLEITETALKEPEILSAVIIMDDMVGLGGKLSFQFA
ncbi:MAG: UPF0280 family protein [Bacteroidales bacterium]|nr:UPF0280 family protein [Bacteroidales bacterium]